MKIDKEALVNIKSKINELQSLFKYGERVLPFLEDLLMFISDIAPILTEMEVALEDSTSQNIKASDKLESVTNQTEMATQEILDTVDNIMLKSMDISTYFNKISENSHQKLNLLVRTQKEFKNILNGNINEKRIQKLIKSIDRHQLNRANRLSTRITEQLTDIESMSMNIMMALQVQDITSQQLGAVNHLIGSIQNKIVNLLRNFSNVEGKDIGALSVVSYDEDAVYENKTDQQDIADQILKEQQKIGSTQKDIDQFLDSGLHN